MAASTSLVFRLIGVDAVSPATRSASAGMGMLGAAVAGTAAIVAGASIKMAADWEVAMTRTITGAGATAQQIADAQGPLLNMLGELGMTANDLGMAFYNVNSAGFRAADGIEVTRVAAMGARVGAADLYATVDGLTSIMNAYQMSSDQASRAMNVLIGTEVYGKATLEELAKAFPTVATAAATAGIKLEELGGAMAAMTNGGLKADVAATYLRQTIIQMSAQTPKAERTMAKLGLKAIDVAKTLGEKGLGAAINLLTGAIKNNLGPEGVVLIKTLTDAASSETDFGKALENMSPKARTFVGAMADMVGGTKSMQGALMLGGAYAERFAEFTKNITERANAAGGGVEGWAEAQETLNFKLAAVKGTMQAFAITLGNVLLPYAKRAADMMLELAQALREHESILPRVGAALAAFGMVLVGAKIGSTIAGIVSSMKTVGGLVALVGGPFTIAAAVIAGAIYLIWSKTDWLQRAWAVIWPAMRSAFSAFVKDVREIWEAAWPVVRELFMQAKEIILPMWEAIWPKMQAAIEKFTPALTLALEPWKILKDTIVAVMLKAQEALGIKPPTLSTPGATPATPAAAGAGATGAPTAFSPAQSPSSVTPQGAGTTGAPLSHPGAPGPGPAATPSTPLTEQYKADSEQARRDIDDTTLSLKDWIKTKQEEIKAKLKEWGPQIRQGIKDGFNAVKEYFTGGEALADLTSALSTFASICGTIGTLLWETLKTAWTIAVDIGSILIDAFVGGVKAWWAFMPQWLAIIGEFLLQLGTLLIQPVKTAIEIPLKIGDWIGTKLRENIWDPMWKWVTGIDFSAIGKAIVNGITAGLNASSAILKSAWQTVVDVLPGWMKSALGISSPSKVMRAMGVNVVQGLILGISSGQTQTRAAAANLAGALSGGFGSPSLPVELKRSYGEGDGSIPAGHRKPEIPKAEVEFKGEREVADFVRKLVKKSGGGNVQRAFGAAGK